MDTNTAKPKLTARQEEILGLISDAISRSGLPPTRAEIATRLGFASANAAEEHLRALARKGYVELTPGTSRAKQLTLPLQSLQQLTLPLIGRVAAGSPILAVEHIEKQVPCDPSLFDKGADYLLKVRGMSMKDAGILEGDYLAVKKTSDVRNGEIVVARLEDEVTVKRWSQTKGPHGIKIELIAENPDFKNIIVDPRRDEITIEGLAVGLIRPGGL
jgi:repressor LexA